MIYQNRRADVPLLKNEANRLSYDPAWRAGMQTVYVGLRAKSPPASPQPAIPFPSNLELLAELRPLAMGGVAAVAVALMLAWLLS